MGWDSEMETVDVLFVRATAKAICVRDSENGEDTWLPKSLCALDDDDPEPGAYTRVTGPEWLLNERGLL